MLTREGGDTLTEDVLGNIAREMVLTEAIIRRLVSRYDASLLRAMHLLGPIFLEDKEKSGGDYSGFDDDKEDKKSFNK